VKMIGSEPHERTYHNKDHHPKQKNKLSEIVTYFLFLNRKRIKIATLDRFCTIVSVYCSTYKETSHITSAINVNIYGSIYIPSVP
jgi:hypothetical protein